MLPSLTVSFLAGLAAGSIIPYFPLTIGAGLLLLMGLCTWAERTGALSLVHSTACYAAVLAGVLYWVVMVPLPVDASRGSEGWAGHSESWTGRIVEPVRHAPHRVTLTVDLDRASTPSVVPSRVRLTWRDPGRQVYQGDRIVFQTTFHPPSGSLNPRGFDYEAYVERQGIEAVGTVTGSETVQVRESGLDRWSWTFWGRLDRWRGTIREAALSSLQQPALGIFLGTVIGERGYLDDDVQEWFMVTGTVHLLSISGSHLGVIAVAFLWGWRRLILLLPSTVLLQMSRWITPTRCAVILTWCGVALYALLAGAEVATVRAWIMMTAGLAAVWMGSVRALGHALAAAALVIVLHEPRVLGDISFQLSFLSVLAMVWVAGHHVAQPENQDDPAPSCWRTVGRTIREAGIFSVAVTLLTLPLVAWYFNQIPWIGPITNMVAVPFVGGLIVPLGLLAAGWTWVSGHASVLMGSWQQVLIDGLVAGLRWVASWLASDWRVAAPSGLVLAVWYAGMLIVGVAGTRVRGWVLGGLVVCGAVGIWIWEARPFHVGDQWRVTFLDVGQGDSAVAQFPDGTTVLIDAGAKFERFDVGRAIVGPFLWNQGIRHLDAVVATHPQLDHVGGMPWLLRHVPVAAYWDAGVERPEPFFEGLHDVLMTRQIAVHHAQRGEEVASGGGCRMTVLSPFEPDTVGGPLSTTSGAHLNNHSIVTQLACGEQTVLFAADVETEGLRRLSAAGQEGVTVLKVPHHGGRSSLDFEWVHRVHPRYAVISVGRRNAYGHPVPAVIEAYRAEGSEIARTDQDGAVIVTGHVSTGELDVQRMRERRLRSVTGQENSWEAERDNWRKVWRQWNNE